MKLKVIEIRNQDNNRKYNPQNMQYLKIKKFR